MWRDLWSAEWWQPGRNNNNLDLCYCDDERCYKMMVTWVSMIWSDLILMTIILRPFRMPHFVHSTRPHYHGLSPLFWMPMNSYGRDKWLFMARYMFPWELPSYSLPSLLHSRRIEWVVTEHPHPSKFHPKFRSWGKHIVIGGAGRWTRSTTEIS